MFNQYPARHGRSPDQSEHLDYWLRRAEEESVAAIRAASPVVSARHDEMAHAYSALAQTILERSSAG